MTIKNDTIKITYFLAFIIGIISAFIRDFISARIPEKYISNNYTLQSIDYLIQ